MSKNESIKNRLFQYTQDTDSLLKEFFDAQRQLVPKKLGHARRMHECVEGFCFSGGKRIRPFLVYCGYNLFKGNQIKNIKKVSLVTELVHSYLLIHDDVIDKSPTRRGHPTVHMQYAGEKNSEHFGDSLAILAGDLAASLAVEFLLSCELSEETKTKILQKMNQTIMETIYGEELDIRLEVDRLATAAEVLEVYKYKTAKYTFESPLEIGAILAGAKKKALTLLSEYAIACGIAFQIQDDLLDIFGETKDTGKISGNDIKEGKQTLLVAKILELGTKKQRERVLDILGNGNLTRGALEEFRVIARETGALDVCQRIMERNLYGAHYAITRLWEVGGCSEEFLYVLRDLGEFVIGRCT